MQALEQQLTWQEEQMNGHAQSHESQQRIEASLHKLHQKFDAKSKISKGKSNEEPVYRRADVVIGGGGEADVLVLYRQAQSAASLANKVVQKYRADLNLRKAQGAEKEEVESLTRSLKNKEEQLKTAKQRISTAKESWEAARPGKKKPQLADATLKQLDADLALARANRQTAVVTRT